MSQIQYFKIQGFQAPLPKFLFYVTQNLHPFSSFVEYFGSGDKEFDFLCWVLVLIFDFGKLPFFLKKIEANDGILFQIMILSLLSTPIPIHYL